MRAVPKVDAEGVYVEDVLASINFTDVTPIYAPLLAPEIGEEVLEEVEPEITGYIIGVPVTPGLYKPKFDLAAWEEYQEALIQANIEYQEALETWGALPEEEREDLPLLMYPIQPELWLEGLTAEQIEELQPPTVETDAEKIARLEQENKLLAAQNAANADRMEFIEDVIAEMAYKVYE